jgi:hypothetical protein
VPANWDRNICPHCAGWKTARATRCMACRRAVAVRPCSRCGVAGRLTRERCSPCYVYWYRTGRERPAYLWDGTPSVLPCRVCGQPSANRHHRWCAAHYQRDYRARKRVSA